VSSRARPSEAETFPRSPDDVLSVLKTGWLLAATTLGFVAVTISVATSMSVVETFDQRVSQWGYHATYGRAAETSVWLAVAHYGQPTVLRAALVVCGLLLIWKRPRPLGYMLVGLAVVENIVGPATKYFLNRPRPHWLHPIAVEHSNSYPSGHATAAGMFATALVLTALTCIRRGPTRILVLSVVALISGVVAADRILLAVHYLSDVVGGILLGAALALACWWLMLAWARANHTTSG
jgi:membrane-associated phospholipid phosphatase